MLSTLKSNAALRSLVHKMTAMLVARITDQQCELRAAGTRKLGGGDMASQILADHFTLSQPGDRLCPPGFSDLPTALVLQCVNRS